MERNEWTSLSIEELWNFYEQVAVRLSRALEAEKAKVEERLRKITSPRSVTPPYRERRPYPKVLPKYQNPQNPAETWSGRGKPPRWLSTHLRAGKKLDDFVISR